jgi:hypothetical protein
MRVVEFEAKVEHPPPMKHEQLKFTQGSRVAVGNKTSQAAAMATTIATLQRSAGGTVDHVGALEGPV